MSESNQELVFVTGAITTERTQESVLGKALQSSPAALLSHFSMPEDGAQATIIPGNGTVTGSLLCVPKDLTEKLEHYCGVKAIDKNGRSQGSLEKVSVQVRLLVAATLNGKTYPKDDVVDAIFYRL